MTAQIFQMNVEVGTADIDELEHVSNLVYLRWVQDVAVAHSEALGYAFEDYQRLGAFFVVKRHEIEYRRPALLGETVTLRTWISEWKGASSWRETEIFRDDVELVRARTRWALVDKVSGRPRRIPETLRARFLADK